MTNCRVLIVSPIGEIGGAEQVILKMAQLLPSHGIEPVLACMRPGPLVERAKQQGLEVFAFRKHRMRQISSVLQGIRWLTGLIRRLSPDIIHANYGAHLYASPASRLSRTAEIWHIHDYPYHPDMIARLQNYLPSDYILFTTQKVKSGYPRLHKYLNSVVPPTCVDPFALRAIPQQADIRQIFHLPAGPLFLTIARMQAHKGHQYLIAAIPEALRAIPDATFAIVGKAGSKEQASYVNELKRQCAELGIADHVHFLGYVTEQDLVSLLREAITLVHPAVSEGFGLTLLEAMALGTPVIAAASDGPREIITPGENGFLVPTADSAGLAKTIIAVARDQATRDLIRMRGKDFADRKSAVEMVNQIAEAYSAIFAARSANRIGTPQRSQN